MKTTKDIADLFSSEIERIAKGEVRKDVILGLERCSNALIKLARLEMDFAWKNWENQQPNVPWLSTKAKDAPKQIAVEREPEPTHNSEPVPAPRVRLAAGAMSSRITDLEEQVIAANKELHNPATSVTNRTILQDKIQAWQDKIKFLKATASKAA
jgi:hypothetical protein